MKTKLDNRKGLSTVITTLIILVVAVLLAGVVTYYATNVVMTRTTQEEVRIRKQHVWVDEGDEAYAALMVQNLGGRDVLIDKLTVRGVDCPWGAVVMDVSGKFIGLGGIPTTTLDIGQTDIYDVIIYGDLAELSNITDYSLVLETGIITWVSDQTGVSITADYSYISVMVKYYIVSEGEDVSDDFKLKEDSASGPVYAHINNVPTSLAEWDPTISDMPLKSSGSMLFFITDPTNIALNDVGTTISLTLYTSNAQWIVETIVQAAVIEPYAAP